MIETLVVDLGGVAARYRPERRLEALASLGDVAAAVVRERLFGSGFEDRPEAGEYTAVRVMAAVRDALDYRGPSAPLIEAWAQAFEPDADVLAHIGSLPVRRALFTNNGPMLDACLAGPLQSIADAFDEVICSWHLRARKPAAAAFERAAERLGCAPAGLLLLDDGEKNVAAAIRCGWNAACVRGRADIVAAIAGHLGTACAGSGA